MSAAERHAASLGCCAIDIRIVNRRAELPPFYRSLGFVDNGTEPLEEPLLTKPAHLIRMTKPVAEGARAGRWSQSVTCAGRSTQRTGIRHEQPIANDSRRLHFRRRRSAGFCRPVRGLFADAYRRRCRLAAEKDSAPFDAFTVGRSGDVVHAIGGLDVVPRYTWADVPPIDILVVPGGFGTRALLHDEATLGWIRSQAARARQLTSVCTGALLLARAGLLRDRRATTHWAALELLASIDPTIQVQRNLRVVHDRIFTSAGDRPASTCRLPLSKNYVDAPSLSRRLITSNIHGDNRMCRNIKTLFNFGSTATDERSHRGVVAVRSEAERVHLRRRRRTKRHSTARSMKRRPSHAV